MRVSVIGTGYVGLVQSVGLAELGNAVTGIDIDEDKIARLQAGTSPIYEPGIERTLRSNLKAGRLTFTTDLAAGIRESEVIFVAVGTPGRHDRRPDLQYVEAAAAAVGEALTGPAIVVNKSTVPIGTADLVRSIIRERTKHAVDVASNPEFLREGSALTDFMEPDRVVVGTEPEAEQARAALDRLYAPLGCPIVHTDTHTAELIKYAANAMLATQISFINAIAELAEATGADVTRVAEALRMDERIGRRAFLNAGVGYGGSCFPKDVQGLITMASDAGVRNPLLEAVDSINQVARRRMIRRARQLLNGHRHSTIGVWGLAFKPQTDDLRDAPALAILQGLAREGMTIQAFDPVANEAATKVFPQARFVGTPYEAAKDADLLLIFTEWPEFKELDLERVRASMTSPTILDGRNLYEPTQMASLGFAYHSVGRPSVTPSDATVLSLPTLIEKTTDARKTR